MSSNIDVNYIKKEFQKVHNNFLAQNYEKVIEKTFALLRKDPSQYAFYNYIGLSYRQLGQNEKAIEILRKGLKKFPKNHSILTNLATTYKTINEFDKAEEYFQEAFRINSNDFNLLCNYGNLKRDLNEIKDAIKYYEKALNINALNYALILNLAGAYQIEGDFESSKNILKQAHVNFPSNTQADLLYSSIHNYQENDPHLEQLLNKLKLNLPNTELVFLNFAIAKAYSDLKNYKESSKFLITANKFKYGLFENYNFKSEINRFEIIKQKFNKLEFKDLQKKNQPNLIFIVGLPRSGTTLTHQIVSSHSKVYGAGELPIINNNLDAKIKDADFLSKFFKDSDYKNNLFIKNFATQLEKQFRYFDDKIILDKSPLNFIWIGFIKILFPKSKIIHCQRNLRDTALSIYKNYFDGNSLPWSYNENNLVKFIEEYKDLMDFWHKKMPGEIYNFNYENLIKNNVEETKKLINYCNLDWEEKCLDHTKNSAAIKTVSISQARKPIYNSSIKLNESYSDYLQFLKNL
jgi:tetratricopeptide (TPR) repeat protein